MPRLFLRWCRPSQAELGEAGELIAARALRAEGWRIAGRRVRTPHGEIDLVAERGQVLLCVEVKTGRAPGDGRQPVWRPADRHAPRTLARQLRAAAWLAARRGRLRAKVALVEVEVDPRGGATLRGPEREAASRS